MGRITTVPNVDYGKMHQSKVGSVKIQIKTSAALDPVLRRMAKEAETTVEKLAQIAIYNIVSLWAAEKREMAAQGGTDTPEIFAVPSVGNGYGPMRGWFVGGDGN